MKLLVDSPLGVTSWRVRDSKLSTGRKLATLAHPMPSSWPGPQGTAVSCSRTTWILESFWRSLARKHRALFRFAFRALSRNPSGGMSFESFGFAAT